MFRSLWYILKIAVVVGTLSFLGIQQGAVRIEWNDYVLTGELGLFLVAASLLLLIVVFAAGLAFRITALPRSFVQKIRERRRTKGYKTLLRSITSVASGDYKTAYALALRAQKLLPAEEKGLPLLLQAQAAQGQGREERIEDAYKTLLESAETALLGLQGLAQKAILDGDLGKALLLARRAVVQHPGSHGLLKAVYDLELRNRLWSDSLLTLKKAESKGIIPREKAREDRKAIFLILGEMARQAGRRDEAVDLHKKSLAEDPLFVPAVLEVVKDYLDRGARLRALYLLKKAWERNPHPACLPLWERLVPPAKKGQGNVRYRWFEWVSAFHPNSAEAALAVAKAAMEDQLWGEARAALMRAEKLRPSAEVYRTWVRLEEKTTNRTDVIRQWMDRAVSAPADPCWVCTKTGRSFAEWVPLVEPEGYINTLEWGKNPQNLQRLAVG